MFYFPNSNTTFLRTNAMVTEISVPFAVGLYDQVFPADPTSVICYVGGIASAQEATTIVKQNLPPVQGDTIQAPQIPVLDGTLTTVTSATQFSCNININKPGRYNVSLSLKDITITANTLDFVLVDPSRYVCKKTPPKHTAVCF